MKSVTPDIFAALISVFMLSAVVKVDPETVVVVLRVTVVPSIIIFLPVRFPPVEKNKFAD